MRSLYSKERAVSLFVKKNTFHIYSVNENLIIIVLCRVYRVFPPCTYIHGKEPSLLMSRQLLNTKAIYNNMRYAQPPLKDCMTK